MWNINESKNLEFTFQGHLLWVNCLTKCNDNFFASGSNDSDIRIWNFSEKSEFSVLKEHEDAKWVTSSELINYNFAPADMFIVDILLKK